MIDLEFHECIVCATKSGMPKLCQSCLNNRTVIHYLNKQRRVLPQALKKFAPDICEELIHRWNVSNEAVDDFINLMQRDE